MARMVRLLSGAAAACLLLTGFQVADASAPTADPQLQAQSLRAKTLTRAQFERDVRKLTNDRRRNNDCRALSHHKKLRKAARKHTSKMATKNNLSHQLKGEAGLGTRITAAGYRGWTRVAENIAFGFPTPRAVVQAWMHSPGHRRNILDCRLRDLGVGVVFKNGTVWITQDFGRR